MVLALRGSRSALPVFLLALPRAGAAAQCSPPSTPSPLQAAIDAAQPGDVIPVGSLSNDGCSVCVTKPLTFVGPSGLLLSTIQATSTWSAGSGGCVYSLPTGVFNIAPGTTGVVAFQNLRIVGITCWTGPYSGMRGIYSEAPGATIVFDGCEVQGANYGCSQGDDLSNGAAGIEGALSRLVVRDSIVTGGNATGIDYALPGCTSPQGGTAGSGGHAINVSGEVLLIRATLTGGNGGNAGPILGGGSCCVGSPYGTPGAGGSAVVASTVHAWGSVGTGGMGGIKYCLGSIVTQAPAGAPLPPAGMALLDAGPPPQPGGIADFTLQIPAGLLGAIGVGLSGWGPTIPLPGTGAYFLGAYPVILTAAPGLSGITVPLPNDPALVGQLLPAQGAWLDPFLGIQLTNPDLVLVRP